MAIELHRYDRDKNDKNSKVIFMHAVANQKDWNNIWEPAIRETKSSIFCDLGEFKPEQINIVVEELKNILKWCQTNCNKEKFDSIKWRIETLIEALKEEAEKRLQAIREYTDLGSGIKIAMRDLEIRGAGNLLGSEQHGHMEAVGYDLYCKMLNMAVKKEKGELEMEETFETTVDIPISAYIPDSYIRNEEDRMEIYKRIAAVETEEESMDMIDELIDRFGSVPKSVTNLLEVSILRAEAHSLYIKEIKSLSTEIRLFMHPRAKFDTMRVPDLIQSYRGALRLLDKDNPYFLLKAGDGAVKEKTLTLKTLKKLLSDIKTLIVS